jgi:HCOMODA/2-hydroxy-3-carboxy-muconic semialdehyde decarboxylase
VALIALFVAVETMWGAGAPGEKDAAVSDLVIANHILANQGVVDGYGHVSIRNPENPSQYLMARSMAPGLVTAADIMTFDLESNPVGGDKRTSYVERYIHGEIYRVRPDVKAIVHSHSPDLIPFGVTDVPLRPIYHMAAFLESGVPVYEIRDFREPGDTDMLVHTRQLGAALARVLGQSSALLMRGHGGVVVANDLPQVVGRSIYLQINAKLQAQAITFGRPINFLAPGESVPPAVSTYQRAWEIWKREAEQRQAQSATK